MLCKSYRYRFQRYLTSKDIRDIHKILYILCKILLICPYTINNDFMFVVSKIDIIIIILQITSFCPLSYIFFSGLSFLSSRNNSTTADLFTDIIQLSVMSLAYFSSFTQMHYYRKRITELLINVTKCNALIKKIGWEIDYRPQLQKSLLFFIYLMIINLISNIFNISLPGTGPVPLVLYFFVGNCYYNILFCCVNIFLQNVQTRLDHLHTNLQLFSTFRNGNIVNCSEKQIDMANNLKIILDVYSKIVAECEKINYIFYFPLLLEMSNSFFCITATIFHITFIILGKDEFITIVFTVFIVINWNLANFSKKIILFKTIKFIHSKVHPCL